MRRLEDSLVRTHPAHCQNFMVLVRPSGDQAIYSGPSSCRSLGCLLDLPIILVGTSLGIPRASRCVRLELANCKLKVPKLWSSLLHLMQIQRSDKVCAPCLVNFITAVAYQCCPILPAEFTQPGESTWCGLCSYLRPILCTDQSLDNNRIFVYGHHGPVWN